MNKIRVGDRVVRTGISVGRALQGCVYEISGVFPLLHGRFGINLKGHKPDDNIRFQYYSRGFELVEYSGIRRSALTLHLLQEGHRYIMCEVADDDSDFDWMDSLEIVIINGYEKGHLGNTIFLDVNGNEHKSAQPIDSLGCVIEIEGE